MFLMNERTKTCCEKGLHVTLCYHPFTVRHTVNYIDCSIARKKSPKGVKMCWNEHISESVCNKLFLDDFGGSFAIVLTGEAFFKLAHHCAYCIAAMRDDI